MSRPLILVANPGSTSRKYALFEGGSERARLRFELLNDVILCTLRTDKEESVEVGVHTLDDSPAAILPILRSHGVLAEQERIDCIGLRIVAPGEYFLQDRKVDDAFMQHLERAGEHAMLHVAGAQAELAQLREYLQDIPIAAISDSAFHQSKPEYAWNYGIALDVADKHGIKRFGYHGLSVESIAKQLAVHEKVIVCHMGGGVSVTALHSGKSVDTTMGFSPLEGVIMATRSGSIDLAAVNVLKKNLGLDDGATEEYLNQRSGLLALGGSADVRTLLEREAQGDTRAHLALETYIYTIQKAIGQMAASLNGADALVFTGAVGERSLPTRARILQKLTYLDFRVSDHQNAIQHEANTVQEIHEGTTSKPVYVISANEEKEIAERTINVAFG
ncbi:MAG TPA: hypothetical protein VFZ48_02410 [Candidatus Saccharimonadales bacterium]